MEVGIDTTRISRFENRSEKFIKTILTEQEYAIYCKEPNPTYLAIHWACKEAIFKATQDNNYLQYTILNYENGKPYILNHLDYKISITHEGDYVTAIVIV